MKNIPKLLGDYSIAVTNFEASAKKMLSDLQAVQTTAAALPGDVHPQNIRDAIQILTAAASLNLSGRYQNTVVPTVKAARSN